MNGKEIMNNGFSSQEGISLKEYVNDKFINLEKAIDVRFDGVTLSTNNALASAEKAINKSDMAMEKRFDSVNEFRATLSDQATNFIIRTEFELVISRLEQDIKNLSLAKNELLSIATYNALHKDLQKQIEELVRRSNLQEGKEKGIGAGWAWIIGGLTFLAAVVALVLNAIRLFGQGL